MPHARDDAGNIWETDAQGNPVRLLQAAGQATSAAPQQGAMPLGPRDSSKAINASNDAARIQLAREAAERSAQAQAQTLGLAAEKAQREAAEWAATHNPDGSPKLSMTQSPKLTAKERADAIQGYTDADALEKVAADLESRFKTGPGATKGFAGLQDYLPTATNRRFDDTSFRARGRVKRALGFTGGEGNTVGEIALNYGPFLPEAGDRDEQIISKIQALRELAADSRKTSVAILGGAPDANGVVTPLPPQNAPDQAPTEQRGIAQGKSRNEYSAELSRKVDALVNSGASKDEIDAILAANSFPPINPADYEAAKSWMTKNPGKPYSGANINRTVDNSFMERFAGSDMGAALIGAGNAGSLGAVQAMSPDNYEAISGARPLSTMLGGAIGALAPTAAIGRLGGTVASRVAPNLLGGGGAAQFGRNLATDVAYGSVYGGVTEGDPLTGALTAGVGSAGGQVLGSTLGRAAGGMAENANAALLRSRGMDSMTVGQRLGGFAKRMEDRAMSIPGVGDMVRNRRIEGFRDFNRLAFDEAGQPVGARTNELGMAGIDDMRGQIGSAYDQATAGVDIPLDAQFPADLAAIGSQSRMLPTDLAPRFNAAMDNAVQPIFNSGRMTGDTYQQAVRSLKGYRAETTKPGFEADYRGALSQAEDALTSQMQRGGGQSVVDGLGRANAAYRGSKTLEKAIAAAKNGSGSGEGQIFTPAQLNTASFQTAAKFPGARPFADLAEAGQDVLPSTVPDSGTAGRLAQFALPAMLGGGGGFAIDKMGLTENGTIGGLGLAALLAAGGTKSGQKALSALLFDRPVPMRDFGKLLSAGQRKGLFGAGSAGGLLTYAGAGG